MMECRQRQDGWERQRVAGQNVCCLKIRFISGKMCVFNTENIDTVYV